MVIPKLHDNIHVYTFILNLMFLRICSQKFLLQDCSLDVKVKPEIGLVSESHLLQRWKCNSFDKTLVSTNSV
jgi:hypothetical protein